MPFKWRIKAGGCCSATSSNVNSAHSSPAVPFATASADLRRSSTSFWSSTYDRAVRTESYHQSMMKMGILSHLLSSSPLRHSAAGACDLDIFLAADGLLQPSQSTVESILRARSGSEQPDIIRIATDYFDSNQRTSHLCGALLHSINEARTQSCDIERSLSMTMPQASCTNQLTTGMAMQHMQTDIHNLRKLASRSNPFADDATAGRMIADVSERYNTISEEVEKKKRLLGREVRVLKRWKRGCIVGIVVGVVAGVVVVAVVAVVTHAIASVGVPIVAAMAMTRIHSHKGGGGVDYNKKEGKKKIKWGRRRRYKKELGMLRMQEGKLDALARGSFTVRRMLDTLRCLVAGLQEDVERARRLVQFGWAHREETAYVQQVACHLHRSHLHLAQQLDNLEEQLVVCFLIINKARDWVLQEFSPSPS
ncbi:hypothetical protein GOP47_0030466 [Adiantum capillus-veneris]|nr:hypothetical protein GOP47_0030466 [Adiantum capillus-veneris]